MIRRGSYQAEDEEIIWEYEPVYCLWIDIETGGDSSADGSSDEGIKYQENLYCQEKEVVSSPRRNLWRIKQGDQIALRKLKMKLKVQRTSSFSSRTHLKGEHRLNGTWYR